MYISNVSQVNLKKKKSYFNLINGTYYKKLVELGKCFFVTPHVLRIDSNKRVVVYDLQLILKFILHVFFLYWL